MALLMLTRGWVLWAAVAVVAMATFHPVDGLPRCRPAAVFVAVPGTPCTHPSVNVGEHKDCPLTSLLDARDAAREHVSMLLADRKRCVGDADVTVYLLPGRHTTPGPWPFRLGPLDSGLPGHRIVWKALVAGTASISGGVPVTGWTRVSGNVWEAPVPAEFKSGSARNFWVNGVTAWRTVNTPEEVGLDATSAAATITDSGYQTANTTLLYNTNPSDIEIRSDHTWVQHRCQVASVEAIPHSVFGEEPRCNFSQQLQGHSPGTSIGHFDNVSRFVDCEQKCCANEKCLAVVWATSGSCYLLDRTYNKNYMPGGQSYVSNRINGPKPVPRVAINITQPCWKVGRGVFGKIEFPTVVINVGNLSNPNEWYYDRAAGKVRYLAREGTDMTKADAQLGFKESLVDMVDVSHHVWSGITFEHATWFRASSPAGFIERYGGVYFDPFGNGTTTQSDFGVSQAAVTIVHGRSVNFENCVFHNSGAWGLRLRGGTQSSEVSNCTFASLSGGSVYIGDVNDTFVTDKELQMANIVVQDNRVVDVGLEYNGAPGMHLFCARNSSIVHNLISNVPYTGISFNWPSPQRAAGYSAFNVVGGNLVEGFMWWGHDGGGIHTIGRSNASLITENLFRNSSNHTQSVIYIDNFSEDLTITRNIVDDCPETHWLYLQYAGIGAAYDDVVENIWVRDAQPAAGETCNCTNIVVVPKGAPLPAEAAAIANAAGPRQRGSI